MGVSEKQREKRETGTHDVRRGRDGGEAPRANVDREGDEGADEGAELEDGPEDGKGLALVLLERVGHHNRALGGPEQGGGDAEDGACEDEEPPGALRLEAGVKVSMWARREEAKRGVQCGGRPKLTLDDKCHLWWTET